MSSEKTIAIGDIVSCFKMKGVVTGFSGNKVLVQFSFLNKELAFNNNMIKLIEKADTPLDMHMDTPAPQNIELNNVHNEITAEMMFSLEALRFGLAPWGHIKDLTIGYDELESWATTYFPTNNNNGLKISKIRGDFGEGKSHSLQVIRNIAKEKGYLTSWIEVDGNNVTFSRPETVLQQIWSNLEGNDLVSTTKLLDLHIKALEKYGIHDLTKKLSVFPRLQDINNAIYKCDSLNLLDEFGHRIECILSSVPEETASTLKREICYVNNSFKFVKIPPMIGRYVDDRPSDFLETMVGNAYLAQLVGYKGIIITVDEFEVENYFASKSTSTNIMRTKNLLRKLDSYAQNETSYPQVPLGIFIATVDEGDSLGISSIARSTFGGSKELKKLDTIELKELGKKIIQFYFKANGIVEKTDMHLLKKVEDSFEDHHIHTTGYTRAYIKQLMYLLDYYYGPRGS